MTNEERLLKLKSTIDALSKKYDKVLWEKEKLDKDLADEYNINSHYELDQEIEKVSKEVAVAEARLKVSLEKIEKEYGELLEMGKEL